MKEIAELTQWQLVERLTSVVPLRDSELEPFPLTLNQRKGLCFLIDKPVYQSVPVALLCLENGSMRHAGYYTWSPLFSLCLDNLAAHCFSLIDELSSIK